MSSRGGRCVLYVSGFPPDVRAKDLAAEFEKYGKIIRCDIPVSKHINSLPYAFVEYCQAVDAEEAYSKMHDVRMDGGRISIEWARRAPSSTWRTDGDPRRDDDSRGHARASWDRPETRHDDRHDGVRDYRSRDDDRHHRRDHEAERTDDRGHRRDYDAERTEERHRRRDYDTERIVDPGRDTREREHGYDRTEDAPSTRDYERTRYRDYDRHRDREHDYDRSRAYYERRDDRDRDYRREVRDKHERSRSPGRDRRDSGYVDSTATSYIRERHSSGHSREHREPEMRSSQDEGISRQHEQQPHQEKRFEKARTPVQRDDWGPDPAEVDGARTPMSPGIRPAGHAHEA
ncbi:hypothetical protein CALCODRAFT_452684 [Calocera cornea HHB12733]|uniref:Peptidyl-prolyl cis-trans isomerase n=1 Tax=Calocera cornea HHB12733 TaxID=1353952 RepID=A0A165GA04_9BASI|nr:hypothetical protein CALCODRAFT_452684 [Calocera cornea HHB12733]